MVTLFKIIVKHLCDDYHIVLMKYFSEKAAGKRWRIWVEQDAVFVDDTEPSGEGWFNM